MAMEWEAEQVSAVERVTQRCLIRNLSPSSWLQLVQQVQQDKEWTSNDQDALAATLVTCIEERQSLALLAVQYITTALASSNQLLLAISIFKAVLDSSSLDCASENALIELCSLLNTTSISTPIDFQAIFTGERCHNAVLLYMLGIQHDQGSITTLAGKFLAGFCMLLEDVSEQSNREWQYMELCLAIIQKALSSDVESLERRVLIRLQDLLKMRFADKGEIIDQSGNKQSAEQGNEQSLFLSIMIAHSRQKVDQSWTSTSSSSSSVKAIEPEVANLLHFLIDEYSTWQSKVDAVKALFLARLDHRPAMDHDYQQYYVDLFHGIASSCATLAATPTTLGGDTGYTTVWRCALCGLLPSLIEVLEVYRIKKSEQVQCVSTRQCMANVVKAVFSDYLHLLTGCEVMLASPEDKKKENGTTSGQEEEADMMLDVFIGLDDGPARHPVRAALLRSLEDKRLIEREDWKDIAGYGAILADWNDLRPSFLAESAGDSDLSSLFVERLLGDIQEDDTLLVRFTEDHASQQAFAQAIVKVTSDCIHSNELEILARVCKMLMANFTALDIIFLYFCPTRLLQPIASLLEEDGLLQNDEEPAVISTILLFAQLLIQRGLDSNYNIESLLPSHQSHFLASFVRSSTATQIFSSLSTTEQSIVSNWITALFGSDGIPDELIKSSSPQLMLRMTPILFHQSVSACFQGVIDHDTLRGGLTYFLQDLLSYTLPCAINWLLYDLVRCQHEESKIIVQDRITKVYWARQIAIRMEVLSILLLSDNCPQVVHTLVADKVINVLTQSRELSPDLDKVIAVLSTKIGLHKAAKTHLWIKIVQPSMPSCTVDSLLGKDVSIGAIISKRGVQAALQLIMDNLSTHSKSDHLPRAIAMNLFLAQFTERGKMDFASELLLLFTDMAMKLKKRCKSVIVTLKLVLDMLSCNTAQAATDCFEAMQAIIALHLMRLLRAARSESEIGQVAQSYGVLFHNVKYCTVLKCSFLDI